MFVEQPLASPGSAKYAFKFLVLNFHPGPEHPDPVQGDHGAAPHPEPQRPQLASSSTSLKAYLPVMSVAVERAVRVVNTVNTVEH